MKRIIFTAITIVLPIAACIAVGEVALRLFYNEWLDIMRDERSLAYRHDALLGWFPQEGSQREFTGYRTISVRHNKYGFRDHEYGAKSKPRIAFLGDSFVWGFDAEAEERFTERLQQLIPQWEVLNLGVSGYGTDQEFLLLQEWYSILQPDIVFLIYTAGSDDIDNLKSSNFRGYFKPFFTVADDGIVLGGVPVPKAANYQFQQHPLLFSSYFIRGLAKIVDGIKGWGGPRHTTNPTVNIIHAMHEYLQARDTQLAIGFHGYSSEPFGDKEREFCDQLGIPCLDLQTEHVFPGLGNHWTPQGHEVVARRIFKFLQQ